MCEFGQVIKLTLTPRGSLETGPRSKNRLRAVDELPEAYRKVFAKFPYFNLIQSTVFDDVLHTDRPMVVAAPTGCGKTVIFELAIIRVLQMSADLGGAEIPGRNSMHFRNFRQLFKSECCFLFNWDFSYRSQDVH